MSQFTTPCRSTAHLLLFLICLASRPAIPRSPGRLAAGRHLNLDTQRDGLVIMEDHRSPPRTTRRFNTPLDDAIHNIVPLHPFRAFKRSFFWRHCLCLTRRT
ncbi:hypothetical protein HYQ45_009684 [Verticillium longisporum]|uniref:Secreted protein n=1 Tax=Verticillium longisporum TaxID=100787 RepID=A0A8I3APN4_VERLO|nr:hypothetical protein HYQ45_009684 [Verticillium longisporum]